jgi:methionyl-tRNA formyltransferase
VSGPTIVFAGDRQVAVDVLGFLRAEGVEPAALLVTEPGLASHASALRELCPHLSDQRVLEGGAFREPAGVELLASLGLDYVVGVHLPYLVPPEVLAVPRVGVLNLHPAYLPYNRGWHTPTWAILEGTPYGATLHFMDEDVDTGDIVHQLPLEVRPHDTADSLYRRVQQLEVQVFREAWPLLASADPPRTPQPPGGTSHGRRDLEASGVQRLDLDAVERTGDLLDRLRALTTSRVDEAAWFEADGRRYRVQVRIDPEQPG